MNRASHNDIFLKIRLDDFLHLLLVQHLSFGYNARNAVPPHFAKSFGLTGLFHDRQRENAISPF
jgi:hypothetical protein